MDRPVPNGDFTEAILNSSFDWDGIRAPFVFATENDSLNGATMLLGYLLTTPPRSSPTSGPTGARTRCAESRANARGPRGGRVIHLINSGAATLDATGRMGATASRR